MTAITKNFLVYSALTLIIGTSFWQIYCYGVNVPHWDDHAIRVFVDNFKPSSFLEIFKFHNEHRIGFTRLAALISTTIEGSLNFKSLMYFGNLGLCLTLVIYVYLAIKLDIDKLLLLIVGLFIFNTSTFENSLWAMAAIQNHWILFWSLLSLTFLTVDTDKKNLIYGIAILGSLFALFTSGNGVLVPVIGLLILFFKGERKKALIWLSVHTVILIFYFIGFEKSGASTRPNIEGFFLNVFALSGSFSYPVLSYFFKPNWAIVAGIANLIWAVIVFFQLLFRRNSSEEFLTFLAFSLFLFGTLALVAMGRNEYDRTVLLSSKYKIYSFLILANNLFFGLKTAEMKFRKSIILALIILGVYINTQIFYRNEMNYTHDERVADFVNLNTFESANNTSYKPSPLAFQEQVDFKNAILDEKLINDIKIENTYITFFENDLKKNSESYLWLVSKESKTVIPFKRNAFLLGQGRPGEARLWLYNFPTDIYQLYFMEISDGTTTIKDCNKTLRIKGIKYTEASKNW